MPLLGPDGKVMAHHSRRQSSFDPLHARQMNDDEMSMFKKAKPPRTGNAFGDWAGRDLRHVNLPGGSALMFDLSQLTISDFRQMRWHPQVNISLSILNFMFHQLEWQIVPVDKQDSSALKIASACQENIRFIWSQLVGAINQAFWAGYAPTVVEWENNAKTKYIEIVRFKDLVPEESEVNWRTVEGWAPPDRTKPKFKVYDGIRQIGSNQGWPIPADNCVTPDTPILCADYAWRPAGELNVGQQIIAFDDEGGPRGRRFRTAEIVVNNRGTKPCVRITTDIGDPIEASTDHPFLVRKVMPTSKIGWGWTDAADLKPGDEIAFLGHPWEFDDSREAGWVAGMYDGEGYLSDKGSLTLAQRPGPVMDRLKAALADRGFDFVVHANKRDDCLELRLNGGVKETVRFLAMFRPSRLMREGLMDGLFIKANKSVDLAVVTSVDDIGVQPIASIQTSCGTFVTGGYASHNTFWYPLLMENGDYYGRKLLKPAFMPWYFSLLVHLFANRYYERFGEPTPIGRAPYDDEVVTEDGDTITGRQAIEIVMQNLRSRGVVTLPSDRDPVTKEFEYTLDYMESQMRGVDFDRYLGRLDEEISMGMFTPLLLFRSGDVGSNSLGVQHTQCVHPDTKILCADLVWRRAGDLKAGDEIVAFDEDDTPGGRGKNTREYRTAVIEDNRLESKPSVTVETDIGDPITMSADHPCLVWLPRRNERLHGTSNPGLAWKDAGDLTPGDQIAYFGSPWDTADDFDGGWISGMWDGEGCLAINTSNHGAVGRGIELSISQNDGPVWEKMKQILTDDGFQISTSTKGHGNQRIRINGGFYEAMRCVGTYQPVRLVNKAEAMWEGRGLRRGQSYDLATVTSVTEVGDSPVASIQTSAGTFITEGYLTHNTFLWMLNGIYGDIKYYIDRYILKRWKAINFSPNAPDIEWSFRKMGKESQETLRAIINSLISADKVMPDLDELGQALGMTVKEVRETKDSPEEEAPPSGVDDRTRDDKKDEGNVADNGEPRATGRQISARVAGQVQAAWRRGAFDSSFTPSLGYERRMVESFRVAGVALDDAESRSRQLYARMEAVVADLASLGTDSFSGPADVMAMFDRHLDLAIDQALAS